MAFNFNDASKDSDNNLFLHSGIDNTLVFKSCDITKGNDGQANLQFVFTTEDGKKEFKHTEWNQDTPRDPKDVNDMMRRILHICTSFINEADFLVKIGAEQPDCETLFNKVSALSKSFGNNKLTVKLVYKKSGFLIFPRFGSFISSDFAKRDLVITKWEQDNAMVKPATVVPTDLPF